jgi:N-formylglutamate deformylase
MIANRVVVHVPHSSLVVPGDAAADLLITPNELDHELLLMTDHYTDELFALPLDVATTVTFPVSRIVVDPERFTDDDREPMTQKGMGVVYTRTSDGRPLRQAPTPVERSRLLARFYEPHHTALTTAVTRALEANGSCLVLDAHSFPSLPLPYEDDQRPDRPEICIGTDPQHTPPWLRDAAVVAFERAGFRVAVDRPFSGALVPMTFYQRELRVHGVMVEVNRALYMNEATGAQLEQFAEVRRELQAALATIFRSSPS